MGIQAGNTGAEDGQGVLIIPCVVIGYAGYARMHFGPAQLLGRDMLARCRLYQGWAAQKDRSRSSYNHCFIANRGHISASRRTGAHDGGQLRDTKSRHACLIVEYPSKVFTVGEDVRL